MTMADRKSFAALVLPIIQLLPETADLENKTVQRRSRELQIENNHGRTKLKVDRPIKQRTQQRLRRPAELQAKWLHVRQRSYLCFSLSTMAMQAPCGNRTKRLYHVHALLVR